MMGNKAAGIVGGIFALLGAAGLLVLWLFFIGPYIELNESTSNIRNILFWIPYLLILSGSPYDPNLLIILGQIGSIYNYLQVMNGLSGINILGIGIPLMVWVIGDVGLIAVGGILGCVGAGED